MDVEKLRQQILKLTPVERRALKARVAAAAANGDRDRVPRRDPASAAPLSFAQQRLWFLDQYEPGSGVYNIALAARLEGSLDAEALRRAFETIVARHEVLRTTFPARDGVPIQAIAPPPRVELPLTDLQALGAAQRESALRAALDDEANRPFDLQRDLMLRVHLFRVSQRDHALLFVLHHIAADGWSLGVIGRELSALYAAYCGGTHAELPKLPIQYADYAQWQREHLSGGTLESAAGYWRERLDGAPPSLELPSDRPRPVIQTFKGAAEGAMLPLELSTRLNALSRSEGVTLFMTLLAAFATLLHRYANCDDIVIGTASACRNRGETENLVGFFANTLPLRMDVRGNPTFRELLGRARETALGAYAHQEVPFEALVEMLRLERSLAHTPLVQTAFVLQNYPASPVVLPGLTITPVTLQRRTARFDLSVLMWETPVGLAVEVEYNTDLFDAAAVKRLLRHFENLLTNVVQNPVQRISRLPLLEAAERRRMVEEWNATAADFPRDEGLYELFSRHVARTPDAVAIAEADRTLTYAQLDVRARSLAHELRARGVGPGVLVAVCLDRTTSMIVAWLAVLHAGGAYVPIDPDYPAARRVWMIEDAGAKVLVSDAHWRGEGARCLEHAVDIASLEDNPEGDAQGERAARSNGESLAYVMYTSGSAGVPKGVAVPQRAIARLVLNTDYVKLAAEDAIAQVSNAAFDAATFEVWGALLNGARLVMLPTATMLTPHELEAALARHGVTAMFLTTALFNQIARVRPSAFRGLRYLLFGGEVADPRAAAAVLEAGPPRRLLHVYGPTEATTFSTHYVVERVPADAANLPIGRPIANTEAYVLDAELNPVPINVAGELYIGGPGLALGYFGRPELTAEKFIGHPFRPGDRLYRTGDLARYRADGTIDFLGRTDWQMKIRGFRVEPAEIESALKQHSTVRDAVVVAREVEAGERRLFGYVVARAAAGAPAIDPRALREFARGLLPSHMVPSAIRVVDAFPLTPNGKIDRDALPKLEAERPGSTRRLPQSPLEHQLLVIWRELLGTQEIGTRDNFFDLGGHSLLAVRMIEAIERHCNHRLPLTALFADATIEGLAAAILRQGSRFFDEDLVAINSQGPLPPFFFVHGDYYGGGLYTLKLARALGADQPFYVFHPHGLGGRPLRASIEEMARDHVRALKAFRPRGPYLLGGYCNGGLVAFEMARQLRTAGDAVDFLAVLDASAWNSRLHSMQVLANAYGTIRGYGAERKLALFLELRSKTLHVLALARRGRAEVLRAVGRKLWRSAARLMPVGSREPIAHATPSIAAVRAIENGVGRTEMDAVYRDAVATYVPRRYAGRITVLRSRDEGWPDEDLGWRAVADEVDAYEVAGDHFKSITDHAQAVGELLRECLDTAREGAAPQRWHNPATQAAEVT